MSRFFKRIGAILLALTLCLGTSLTAFATEDESGAVSEIVAVEDGSVTIEEITSETRTAVGLISDTFTLSKTLTRTLTSSQKVTFIIAVTDNSSGLYDLTITYQDGTQIYSGKRPGDGTYPPLILNASAGTYTFSYTYAAGTYKQATAIAGIL